MACEARKRVACDEGEGVEAEKKLKASELEDELEDDSWADQCGTVAFEDDSWADQVGSSDRPPSQPCALSLPPVPTSAAKPTSASIDALPEDVKTRKRSRSKSPLWKELWSEAERSAVATSENAAAGEVPKESSTELTVKVADGVAKPPATEASSCLTVCVRNLNYNVDEDQFELDFEAHGEIDELKFYEGTAYVTFTTQDAVQSALKMDGDGYYGRQLSVSLAPQRHEVFVKGLALASTEESVKTHFSTCGAIVKVKLRPGEEGKSKGSAFLEFETKEARDKALEMDGKELQEEKLVVVIASQQSKGKGKDKGKDKGKGKGKGKEKGKGKKGKGKGKERR